MTRLRLAIFCLFILVAVAAMAPSNLVEARLLTRGVSDLKYLLSGLNPQNLGSPSKATESQTRSDNQTPLGAINFSNTYTGPVFPQNMPLGASFVTADPGNTGKIGRAGGNTWYFSNIALPSVCGDPTYWGPGNNLVRLSFVSSSFANTLGEVLSFQPGQSNLGAGIAVWTGFTFNPSSGQQVFTKFTMTANLHSGAAPGGTVGAPISLVPATALGLPFNAGAMVPITPGIDYQINMRFDASFGSGGPFTPALDFYDVNSTAGGTCFESFTAGFYYRNFLPVLGDISDQTTLMNVPSGPHSVFVYDCETPPALSGAESRPGRLCVLAKRAE